MARESASVPPSRDDRRAAEIRLHQIEVGEVDATVAVGVSFGAGGVLTAEVRFERVEISQRHAAVAVKIAGPIHELFGAKIDAARASPSEVDPTGGLVQFAENARGAGRAEKQVVDAVAVDVDARIGRQGSQFVEFDGAANDLMIVVGEQHVARAEQALRVVIDMHGAAAILVRIRWRRRRSRHWN